MQVYRTLVSGAALWHAQQTSDCGNAVKARGAVITSPAVNSRNAAQRQALHWKFAAKMPATQDRDTAASVVGALDLAPTALRMEDDRIATRVLFSCLAGRRRQGGPLVSQYAADVRSALNGQQQRDALDTASGKRMWNTLLAPNAGWLD